MANRTPAIACIGIIDRKNHPLHTALFPAGKRDLVEFSFWLSSCLDIFEARMSTKTLDQDLGLLQAIDERLAMYGRLTNTGVKLVIVIDSEGGPVVPEDAKNNTAVAVRDTDLKPAFRALHAAYIDLLRNPFYLSTMGQPNTVNSYQTSKQSSSQITDRNFIAKVRRIGESWSLSTINL